MYDKHRCRILVFLLLLVLSILDICSFLPPVQAASSPVRTLTWSVVKTPGEGPDNVIRSNSEINSMALGDGIIYCADTENRTLFRSSNGGYSFTDISSSLTAAGANLPVWSIAVAPDNALFVVVATDLSPTPSAPSGPQQVYVSIDGGNNWQNSGLNSLGMNEYISCIDISKQYGNALRDIAVGTRITAGLGHVLNHQYGSIATPWLTQAGLTAAVTSLKFSPNYATDSTLAVISCDTTSTTLSFGLHDTNLNTTIWSSIDPFASVTAAQVIGTDLALPSDFNGQNPALEGCFTSIQTGDATPFTDPMGRTTHTGVYYINTLIGALPYTITPLPVVSSTTPGRRIYSIAYNGSQTTGILLAGEATANPAIAMVPVYQSSNAQSFSPGAATWTSSQDFNSYKSPTGGGNSGLANAILGWGHNGVPYCATSSEDDTIGGTAWLPGQWPFSKLNGVALDESAFSYSSNSGLAWNQISLIDTEITRLSDTNAAELASTATQGPGSTLSTTTQGGWLYLASLNENSTVSHSFDSVWRSTSDVLGDIWERVLADNTSHNGTILRMNTRAAGYSTALIFGDLATPLVLYSPDAGQTWEKVLGISSLRDLVFKDDSTIYALEDYWVRLLYKGDTNWVPGASVYTDLPVPGHTICVPLANPRDKDMVFIGTGIPPPGNPEAYVAWSDFAENEPKFTVLRMLPKTGNVHVLTDSKFDQNSIIYAAVNADFSASNDGTIYRWELDKSTDWDELEPPDLAFFGVAMAGDVLYGTFNFNTTTLFTSGGVDRTLYPRVDVPPAPEWDQLVDGLPVSTDANYPVLFTREPTSLKISSNNLNNTLWAIDNIDITKGVYSVDNKTGCLWRYIDSAARASPWPIAPPSGSLIGADPVTGRSQQIDIKWRPLLDMFGYDLLMAKDVNFTTLLSQNLNMFPVDNKTGAWVVGVDNTTGKPIVTLDQSQQLSPGVWIPPGILEAGRPYYWKVRGSRTVTGASIHSLWSPVMFFSVKPGFAVRSSGNGPQLLTPIDGVCNDCQSSIGFSWTPVKNAKKYEFTLAYDQDLKNVIVQTVTTTTAFKYEDSLQPGRIYFWQVKAVAPFESDPSPTGTFVLAGSQPLIPWESLPPSYFWIAVIIITAVILVLISVIFIYNYLRRY